MCYTLIAGFPKINNFHSIVILMIICELSFFANIIINHFKAYDIEGNGIYETRYK